MESIVFIHGFGGGSYEFQPIIKFLRKKGFKIFYEFTYSEKWGQISLEDIAKKFSNFVREKVKEKKVAVIGISQGGIIARIFIQKNNQKTIRKCITLCTPHNGSLTAYLSKLPGYMELRPRSKLLKKLNSSKLNNVHYYSVYTPFDLMVFPGWYARFKGAERNKIVFAPIHPLAFWWPSTLRFIIKALRDKSS